MAISRRTMIKGIGIAAAAVPILPYNLFSQSSSVFLLLHGLFFMEFYDGLLYVCTPQHNCHRFLKRMHGSQTFQPLDHYIDWSSDGKYVVAENPSSLPAFPTDILQLSAKLLKLNGPALPGATKYACKMILPQPRHIFGYRTDSKAKFKPDSGPIANALLASIGPRLAAITCLEYAPGSNGPFTQSFYAEHDHKPTNLGINAALLAAQDILGSNFVLTFSPPTACAPTASGVDDPGSLPGTVDDDDEKSLQDPDLHLPASPHVSCNDCLQIAADVASCPQFGINHP